MTAEIVDLSPNKRKLVTVRTIDAIEPIEGADAIELAVVEGWKVVIKKGEFAVGDKCVYFEIDSFLPTGNPAWQFLVDKSGREFEGVYGHRLRTVKLRGQISQGLVLRPDLFKQELGEALLLAELDAKKEGGDFDLRAVDFAQALGIKKWEAPLPAELAGQAEGLFPSWMRKTDQERCQNLISEIFQTEDVLVDFSLTAQIMTAEALTALNDKGIIEWVGDALGGRWMKINKAKASVDDRYEVTMKLDGSSMTVFARSTANPEDPSLVQTESGVCSRNLQLKVNAENADNTFIRIALQSGLLGVLEDMSRDGTGNVAVQGELMGPGIQGNRENLKTHQLFIFDVQFLDAGGGYLTPDERTSFMRALYDRGVNPDLVKHVPVLHYGVTLAELGITNVKELLAAAEHPSLVHPVAEGDVYKRMDGGFSFKAINNVFLAKEKD